MTCELSAVRRWWKQWLCECGFVHRRLGERNDGIRQHKSTKGATEMPEIKSKRLIKLRLVGSVWKKKKRFVGIYEYYKFFIGQHAAFIEHCSFIGVCIIHTEAVWSDMWYLHEDCCGRLGWLSNVSPQGDIYWTREAFTYIRSPTEICQRNIMFNNTFVNNNNNNITQRHISQKIV